MKIHVIGNIASYDAMFLSLGFELASIEEAEMICFTGGADVSPNLYGEKMHNTTGIDDNRDEMEVSIFNYAVGNDIPMIGICRGGQFLHVMNGGRLWQNVGGHANGKPHILTDLESGHKHSVTSTHHQMMRFEGPGVLVAVAAESKFKERMGGRGGNIAVRVCYDIDATIDVEVIWYEDSKCLCFQPHPEFHDVNESADSTKLYFKNLLSRFFDIK